jgi:hypothetical protein
VYAGAAFSTSAELFKFGQSKTVLDNSNLANIAQLAGHERFTYALPGTVGIACSEPTRIEGDGLAILSRLDDFEPLPFDKHVIAAAKVIDAAIQESSRYNRDLFQVAVNALDYGEGVRIGPFMRALKRITAFSYAFNVSYYAIG